MVSILIVSHNHAKFIGQAITSAISQTYRDIEIIYLDNASEDASFAIAEDILERSGIIYKAYRRDKSYTTAQNFNFLLRISSCDYVCLLSADDWLHTHNIEKKMKVLEENRSIVLADSNGYKYYQDVNVYEPVQVCYRKNDPLQEILKKNFISGIGCVIKKEALLALEGWDETLMIEDWDLWIRLVQKFQVACIDEYLFFYRQHVNALSNDTAFMFKGKMETYHKHATINNHKKQTLQNIRESYWSRLVMGEASIKNFIRIIKIFRFKKSYVFLLIKALLPMSLKRKCYYRQLKKSNPYSTET